VTVKASIKEHGDHIYITSPVQLFTPDAAEIETFAFAKDLQSQAPNSNILWLKGQYVEADAPNRNADQWTAGELAIKQLTPVLMPITVMHDLRSAVGTIADAGLLTPEKNGVPRARLDTTLAVWAHRFPEIAAECKNNAGQGTLMQSMECLSAHFDCSVCGQMLVRDRDWQKTWREHTATHTDVLSSGRSASRILRNVTFTGVGLIFGTRGARGAMPDAFLEVEELAAMHAEAHSPKRKPPRRKNTVEIEDSKYESMVAAKAEVDSKVSTLATEAAAKDQKIETLEAQVVTLTTERDAAKVEAEAAKEVSRVAAMADERISALGAGFTAKLSKMETTAKTVRTQAGSLSDELWASRLVELEELLGVKRDAAADPKAGNGNGNGGDGDGKDATAGLLFTRKDVAASAVGGGTEVTAGAGDTAVEPSLQARQGVMGGLIRPRKKETAGAK
jgi:hypothetical protein